MAENYPAGTIDVLREFYRRAAVDKEFRQLAVSDSRAALRVLDLKHELSGDWKFRFTETLGPLEEKVFVLPPLQVAAGDALVVPSDAALKTVLLGTGSGAPGACDCLSACV